MQNRHINYKADFPVGTKVRMVPSAVDSYYADIQRRVKDGRIGCVTGHAYPSEVPMVTLLKDGRKQEFAFGRIRTQDWEVIELPEIAPNLENKDPA